MTRHPFDPARDTPKSPFWIDHPFAALAAFGAIEEATAVLPVAAVEQHGPHLPVGTDSFIMQGHLDRVVPRLGRRPVLILPVQSIGKSNEHIAFPGTLTLSAETVIRAWTDIGDSVARAGVRRLVILNSHGGNVAPIDIVARELRVRHRMLAVPCSWTRLGLPPDLFAADEMRLGIHGGDYETSVMLAFRPDTVDRAKAERFPSLAARLEQEGRHLRATQPIGFGWAAQDLNPAGVVGDASIASAEKGEAAANHAASAFIDLLDEVMRFDLARLAEGPLGA